MIRLAFLGVIALAGLLAFGAFFLARGTTDDVAQSSPDAPPAVVDTPEPDPDKTFYFLRDLALEGEGIAVVLFNVGPARDTFVVRDAQALQAAKDVAAITSTLPTISATEAFVLNRDTTSLPGPFLQVYRNDELIQNVVCPNGPCESLMDHIDVNYAGLLDNRLPIQRLDETFDDYADYLSTIDAIAQDPDFMLLHARPRDAFPHDRMQPYVTLLLPNVVVAEGAMFDSAIHEALVDAAITPVLPDGAQLDWVRVGPMERAVLADKDNNSPVQVNGADVVFPNARYFQVTAKISGVSSLPAATLDTLTATTARQEELDREFEAFVTAALSTTCIDCYLLKVESEFTDQARILDATPESYSLSYYDLRDAP